MHNTSNSAATSAMLAEIGYGSFTPPRGGPLDTLPRRPRRGKGRGVGRMVLIPVRKRINGHDCRVCSARTIYMVTDRGWRRVVES